MYVKVCLRQGPFVYFLALKSQKHPITNLEHVSINIKYQVMDK